MSEKIQGTVKWFNITKGFGFIAAPDGKDVFVHYSDIQTDGFKNLSEGQEVAYILNETGKGLRALEVSPLS